jgi:spermidine/putrescine transport system permease protein
MFPTFIYGASRVGIPPQAFGMATLIFTAGAIIALVNVIATGRNKGKVALAATAGQGPA